MDVHGPDSEHYHGGEFDNPLDENFLMADETPAPQIDGATIELRTPKYNASGMIDVEINHPVYGWIWFTCDPTDVMPYSKDIHDRALAMGPAAYESPIPTSDDLKAYAQTKRAELANGSATITVSQGRDIPVWVDAESRGSILGLVVASQSVPTLTTPWKGSDGNFYVINAVEMSALAFGMMTYVQKCFGAEAQIDNDITSGVTTTTQAIDVSFATLMAA